MSLALERDPYLRHAFLELMQCADVVDHVVGARAFELGGYLRRDHVHRHGCVETAEAHQSLEPHLAGCVDEDQPVKVLHHPALEEERNVADDDSVAAVAGIGYETVAEG